MLVLETLQPQNLELLHPEYAGEVDHAVVDSLVSTFGDNQSTGSHTLSKSRLLEVENVFRPLAENIHELRQLPATTNISLEYFSILRSSAEPGMSFNKVGDYWHQDGDDPGSHAVLFSTEQPTEVMTGLLDLLAAAADLEALSLDLAGTPDYVNSKVIEDYINSLTEDPLALVDSASLRVGISQLLPYRGYLMNSKTYHKPSLNRREQKMSRALFFLLYREETIRTLDPRLLE